MSVVKDFKDLEFRGRNESLRQLPDELEASVPDGWIRGHELEEKLSGHGPMYVFVNDASTGQPAAGLCLTFRTPDVLYVSNIVPREKGELSYDEYNAVLDLFALFARGVAKDLGLDVHATDGEWRIERELSPASLDRLRRFSDMANRATGSSHPLDEKRWFGFIAGCHREGSELAASDLFRWFAEGDGWPEPQARDLSNEYAHARRLLKFYDHEA